MASSKRLIALMATPLPSLTEQKRMVYRPSLREVHQIYNIINQEIFKNSLIRPEIQLGSRRECWGLCVGYARERKEGSRCVIKLSDKWYCKQWLITVLAHEMAHQYQWDVLSPKRTKKGLNDLMSHGPTFFLFRNKMLKNHIPLRTAHRKSKWFQHQHMHRC